MHSIKITILLFFTGTALAVADSPPIDGDIYKPTFLFADDSLTAGTAFLVGGKAQNILVTCHHLFGPDGGLQQQRSPDDIVQQIHGAVALSMKDQTTILQAPVYLKVADAFPLDAKDYSKDLALFVVASPANAKNFKLAATMPKIGDHVWVYARLRGTNEAKLFSAIVSEITSARLRYIFDDPSFNIAGTSGSPVLDQKGEVVGMNLGGGTTDDKKRVYGAANPASSISQEIATVLTH